MTNRIKKVFSNAEQTIHVWAQQTQSEGRSSNVYFEGATVYSYGSHYPLGLITKNKKGETAAIINTSGYSLTTSKHIGITRHAVNHYKRFDLPSTQAMKSLVTADRYNAPHHIKEGLSEAIENVAKGYASQLLNDRIKRKASTLEKWKSRALAECNSYIQLLDWFDVKMTAGAKKALTDLTGKSPAEAKELASIRWKAAAKAQEKARKARLKERAENREEAVKMFKEGLELGRYRDYLYEHEEVLMRVKGDTIETSKGASFPLSHGKKAFKFIKECKYNITEWQSNGHKIHLGNFAIDRIETNGDVKAGCHTVKYSEIERIAKQLKLI